jgi:hypothetical protein
MGITMKWNESTKKSAAYGLVGLVGIFTGTFLPPELFQQVLGVF